MANILVKPFSDSDGNLVILADNMRDLHLVDVTTGEIIERGRNAGASNGRGATFRFTRPGSSYRNVGLMDHNGNILVTLETAGDRVQFNYSDYNALVRTPVSTINGYRWDNSANQRAQAEGRPSNANIGQMTSEEYIEYLNQQQGQAGTQPKGGVGGGGSTMALAGLAAATPYLTGVDPLQELGVLSGVTEGPLTETQAMFPAMADVAGGVTAGINAYDAFGNLTEGDEKGQLEGASTLVGTGIGALLGGWPGAGIGSVVGRTAGRGLAWVGDKAFGFGGPTTREIQRDRFGNAINAAATDVDRAFMEGALKQNEEAGDRGKASNYMIEEGPLKGRKYNWKEVEALAGPEDVWGMYGFLEAFPDWLSGYTEEQRRTIAQAALDNDLLESDKGSILFSGSKGNLDKIRQIAQEVKAGTYVPGKTPEQRQAERQAYAESIGVQIDPASTTLQSPGAAFEPQAQAQPQAVQRPANTSDFLSRQVPVDSNSWMPTEQQIASGGRGPGPVTPDEVAAAFQDKTPQSLYDGRRPSQVANTQAVFGEGQVQPQAILRTSSQPSVPQGAMPMTRAMVPTDTDINPPITDYEQIDGASLPPPGQDNALMAWNFLQSAPSQSLYAGLMDEVFSTSSKKKPLTANFEQLQGAFS